MNPASATQRNHVLSQLKPLHEAFKRSQVRPASSNSQDQQPRQMPPQRRLTQQSFKHWPQFNVLRQRHAGTRSEEQRQLHLPQKYKATVPELTLRVEMNGLVQADNSKARDLFWKPLSWLGTIPRWRPHEHVHSSFRYNQGARLDGRGPCPSLPHGWTHGPHPA
jgi:hypothetical protein